MSGKKVLLVDDEREFVEVLAMRLEARSLQVDTAESGDLALEKVQAKSYDAIVLDIAMPGLDGMETLKRLKELNPDSQVVLLSGHATVRKATEAMGMGALDVLEKPADIDELVARIDQAAANKAELTEKRIGEQVSDIIGKKGW
jgi:DNA-binding NtrC family response regulator